MDTDGAPADLLTLALTLTLNLTLTLTLTLTHQSKVYLSENAKAYT